MSPASQHQNHSSDSVALLDVDGTLVYGVPLGIRFSRYLAETTSQFPESAYQGMVAEAQKYKTDADYSYPQAASSIVDYWSDGVTGLQQDQIQSHARQFVQSLADDELAAVRTLFETLSERHFRSYLISISPQEVLEPFADEITPHPDYTIVVYGTTAATDDAGQYNGAISRDMAAAKQQVVDDIMGERSAARTIAFGDATPDEPLFDAASFGVLISPTPELNEMAQRKGWDFAVFDDIAEFNASFDWEGL